MFKRKSIVLSDPTLSSNKKAVLSLQEESDDIRGTLRLYNFPKELDGICSLGFYVDKKVYKAGLTLKGQMFYEFFISLKEIPSNFSVAVVNFQNAQASPVLYGSSEGSDDDVFASIISNLSNQSATVAATKQTLDDFGVDFAAQEKKIIEKEIENAMCENDCANCVYKKYFFENHEKENLSNFSSDCENEYANILNDKSTIRSNIVSQKEKFEKPQEEKELVFFQKLKPQIDKLFENNPIENNLQNLIPSSKWVKVEYEDDGDFYVFGLLYDEEENVKYVCYGIPAVFDQQPPKELAGFPIWLPLEKDSSFGYWLTYQDAETGEPVKAILE